MTLHFRSAGFSAFCLEHSVQVKEIHVSPSLMSKQGALELAARVCTLTRGRWRSALKVRGGERLER